MKPIGKNKDFVLANAIANMAPQIPVMIKTMVICKGFPITAEVNQWQNPKQIAEVMQADAGTQLFDKYVK